MRKPDSNAKAITILGSTGTIGQNTLDIIRRNRDRFTISALTGNNNIHLLAEQAREFNAKFVVTANADLYADLKTALEGTGIECAAGEMAVLEAAARPADICMAAIVGVAGLKPALKAVEVTPLIALANKECLVSAGELFMQKVAHYKTKLIPVDSEHSAAYQCLNGQQKSAISKLTLTASGGPFRTWNIEQLRSVTKEQALKHPNWTMGAKITIDSATMMNKGLELIEAKYLFSLEPVQIDMVVHPQSVIHCLVGFCDGSVMAHLSEPDMRVPIAYSLSWPDRMETPIKPIDLAKLGSLSFEPGDVDRFPCLRIARQVLMTNDCSGSALNAANEVAVDAFLNDRCGYSQISEIIESVLDKIQPGLTDADPLNFNDILKIDEQARYMALELL